MIFTARSSIRPQLILADEPTAALDRDETMNVIRLLKQTTVEDGAAVLMVTHDHRVIDSADRLVHMVDGRIMSDVVLHDALRICEFLGRSRGSLPMSRKRCRITSLRRRRDDHPQGRSRRGVLPGFRREVEVSRADRDVARLTAGAPKRRIWRRSRCAFRRFNGQNPVVEL